MTSKEVCVRIDFGSITIGNELPDTVVLAVDDRIGAPRVLALQIDQAYQVIDGLQNAIRYALANPSSTCPSE